LPTEHTAAPFAYRALRMCVHRQKFVGLAEQNMYLALLFPRDDPPGWYWGKPLSTTANVARGKFWVNFTADGDVYDKTDDVKATVGALVGPQYAKQWAIVAPKSYSPPPVEHQ
jgi:hypothetical protein